LGPKVTLRGVQHSERLWPARLRWRLRGAWMWPTFFALTAVDGVLITALPPYDGTPPGLPGGVLLAGFANLFLLAVVAPFAGRALRRGRPDLPRQVASDYAGTALIAALGALILVAGIAHRPAVAGEHDDAAALSAAVRAYVGAHAPEWAPGLDGVEVREYAPEVFRACVPGTDPHRWLCLIVDTDRRPARVTRDESMVPDSAARVGR
jgi:hypothetical protein